MYVYGFRGWHFYMCRLDVTESKNAADLIHRATLIIREVHRSSHQIIRLGAADVFLALLALALCNPPNPRPG